MFRKIEGNSYNSPSEQLKIYYELDGGWNELFPVCIERIYRYYYFDDNNNKIYIETDTDIYNINGKDYISIR